jgi:hypothetical protein
MKLHAFTTAACLLFALSVAADDKKSAEPKIKPLSKPIKQLVLGNWTVTLVVDEKEAEKMLTREKVPKDKIPAVIKQLRSTLERTKTTVHIKADGTSVAIATVPDPNGGKKPVLEREVEKWELTETKGRLASVKLTGTQGEKKGQSRIVKVTFLNDDAFRLDEDAELKNLPVKKPIFVRAKKK